MGKKDENYWKDRATEREEYWYKQSREKIEKDLARQYRQSAQKIQDDIAALYGRFAKENGLSLKEATALLKGNEFKEWRYTLEEYNHLAQNNNAILKELNTLAMRSRISRLDKLYSQTLMELNRLGEHVEKSMTNFLSEAYRDNYYKGLFEIGKTAGIHGTISAVDNKRLEDVLRTPWSGKNYSARIWDNQKKLAETIKQTVFDSVHRGVSVPKLSKMVQDRMGVGKYEATRLVRTELNYVHNQANLDSIKDSGMEFYKFVATLDSRTSQKCRSHDGSIVPVEEASPGDNLPPLHPHCRSTIIGSFGEGKGGNKGTRAARVGKGKTFYVPQQMKYEDYKAVYVDRSKSFASWANDEGFTGNLAKYTPKEAIQSGSSRVIMRPEGDTGLEQAKKRNHKIMITDTAIDKVPYIEIPGCTDEFCQELHQTHKEVLRLAQKHNNSDEVAAVYNYHSKSKVFVLGDEFHVDTDADINVKVLQNGSYAQELVTCHNHPSTANFSFADIDYFIANDYFLLMSIVTNQGEAYVLYKTSMYDYDKIRSIELELVKKYSLDAQEEMAKEFLKRCWEGGVKYVKGK